jgi:ATP-dependent DNA ligase
MRILRSSLRIMDWRDKMAIAIMKARSEALKPEDVRGLRLNNYLFQRKYDGSRHLWLDGHIVSERGIVKDTNFPQVFKVLQENFPYGVTLDMEVYVEGGTVLDLNKHENQSKAKCCVFDYVDKGGYSLKMRIETLKQLFDEFKNVVQDIVHLPETFESFEEGWSKVEENNWEGLMLKDKESAYFLGRSNAWIKVKKKSCCDVEILGHEKGSTKGTFIIKMPSGVEGRVSGTSVDIVEYYYKNKPKKMEISYMYLTSEGRAFQPVFCKFCGE